MVIINESTEHPIAKDVAPIHDKRMLFGRFGAYIRTKSLELAKQFFSDASNRNLSVKIHLGRSDSAAGD
jgi:hypothetical protein